MGLQSKATTHEVQGAPAHGEKILANHTSENGNIRNV